MASSSSRIPDGVDIDAGPEVALQLLLSGGPVEAAHSQGLLLRHGIAVGDAGLLPETAIELLGVQDHAVHIEQHALDGISGQLRLIYGQTHSISPVVLPGERSFSLLCHKIPQIASGKMKKALRRHGMLKIS